MNNEDMAKIKSVIGQLDAIYQNSSFALECIRNRKLIEAGRSLAFIQDASQALAAGLQEAFPEGGVATAQIELLTFPPAEDTKAEEGGTATAGIVLEEKGE
jgi:hypothetical protein